MVAVMANSHMAFTFRNAPEIHAAHVLGPQNVSEVSIKQHLLDEHISVAKAAGNDHYVTFHFKLLTFI